MYRSNRSGCFIHKPIHHFPGKGVFWLVVLLCLSVTLSRGQTVFLDFNTPGQYTGNFNPWNDNGGGNGGNYSFAEANSGGVNGSGAVSVFQNNDTTAVYSGGS